MGEIHRAPLLKEIAALQAQLDEHLEMLRLRGQVAAVLDSAIRSVMRDVDLPEHVSDYLGKALDYEPTPAADTEAT